MIRTLLFTLGLLVVMETAAFILHKGRLIDEVYDLLEENTELFWRLRPNYSGELFGASVKISDIGFREGPATHRGGNCLVLSAGASPSFGWGVEADETFVAALERRLFLERGLDVRVLNYGVPGYSSFQGDLFLKQKMGTHAPRVVLFSYLINDVDFLRFFRTELVADNQLEPTSAMMLRTRNLIRRSSLMRVLHAWLAPKGGVAMIPYTTNVRVTFEDYLKNIDSMVDQIRSIRSQPVFVSIPVFFPVHADVPEAEAESLGRIQAEISEKACLSPEELRKSVDLTDYHYYLMVGACRYDPVLKEKYKELYLHARLHRINERARVYKEGVIEHLSKRGVPVADVEQEFRKVGFSEAFLYGRKDYIHPSERGHEIIADLLLPILLPRLDCPKSEGVRGI